MLNSGKHPQPTTLRGRPKRVIRGPGCVLEPPGIGRACGSFQYKSRDLKRENWSGSACCTLGDPAPSPGAVSNAGAAWALWRNFWNPPAPTHGADECANYFLNRPPEDTRESRTVSNAGTGRAPVHVDAPPARGAASPPNGSPLRTASCREGTHLLPPIVLLLAWNSIRPRKLPFLCLF